MRRILILSSSHLCRNPRVVKEATTLGEAGYDVTVMSISSQSRFEKMDLELMRGLPFKRITIDYASHSTDARFSDFVQRSATWAARWLRRKIRIELAQSLGPAQALLRRARSFRSELTILHTEIPIWAGQYLVPAGHRIAVDVEDWYSEDLLFADRQSRPIRLLQKAEAFALRNCAYSSATSQSMADTLCSAYQCPRPIVLRNTFPLQPLSRVDTPPRKGPPRFIWFSQTIGPGRGLELFFAAWVKTQSPSEVYLLGDERSGYKEKLLSRLPVERRALIHFVPLVTPEQLPAKLAEFDIGLALEPHLPLNRDITITNKLFQYLNAGLAVVATDTSGQKEVLHASPDTGVLVEAHETTRYAALLDSLISDPARLRSAQESSRRSAEQDFSWEHDGPRLVAAVARALNT